MKHRVWGSAVAMVFVLLGLADAAPGATTDFTEANTSPEAVDATPSDLVAGDFDQDGDNDLAVTSASIGTVTILLNTGKGNFIEPGSSPVMVGSFANNVVAGDIDDDDDVDLIVSQQESEGLTILRNNGSGVFTPAPTSPEPIENDGMNDVSLLDLIATDLDGDTDIDIAVSTLPDTNPELANIAVLTNDGSGDFLLAVSSPETAGNKPVSLAAGDMDGDGDRDLVAANQQSFTVSVMRNNGSANFTALPQASTDGAFPQAVAIARLNGDAKLDVAAANQGDDKVSIFQNDGLGTLTLRSTSPEAVGDTPLGIASADFDLDGDRDLVTANQGGNSITVLANQGNGNFIQPPSSPEATGASPTDLIAVQLDPKRGAEVAVINSNGASVTIFRNR